MSYTTIHSLLDTQLQTVVGLPTLQQENIRYEPKTGVAWTRSTLIPVESTRLSTGFDLVQGLYQVDAFYPGDKGSTAASTMADLIIAEFPRALTLTSGGVIVHIVKSYREVAQPFQQFYRIPVSIQWNCQLPRG